MNQIATPRTPEGGWAALPRELTQNLALEEARVPPLLIFGVVLIGGLLTLFLGWAAVAHVEERISGSGQIIPSGHVQSIQHLEGGIVQQIMAEEGQFVEAGQPLIRLDATDADADLGQMRARQNSLRMQAIRLRKFVAVVDAKHITTRPLTDDENAILQSMEESRASQQDVLRDQIAQKQKELRTLAETRDTLQKNVALTAEQNQMYKDIVDSGSGSKLMAMTSQRDLNQIQGQLSETRTQQTRAQDAIREAENRLRSLDADLKQDAMKNLGLIEAELDEVNTSLTKVEAAADRTIVQAPVRGVVKGLSVHTLGAVVEPGKVLMEIVPVDKELEVEAMIAPSDIGHLKEGQKVNVKVSAYDFSRYGNVTGKLKTISATTFQTEKNESFYKVKVKLERNYVGRDPERNLILPGMTVQADIITGDKTVLEYLLKPLYIAANTAFHEQ